MREELPSTRPALTGWMPRRCWAICLLFVASSSCFVPTMLIRPNLLEQPFLSKMAWLSIWAFLRSLGFSVSVVDSCAFGSIHKKPFRLLSWRLDSFLFDQEMLWGSSAMFDIEGAYTKPSSVYVPNLAEHFALAFARALDKIRLEESGWTNYWRDRISVLEWPPDDWSLVLWVGLVLENTLRTSISLSPTPMWPFLSCWLPEVFLGDSLACWISRVAKGCHAKAQIVGLWLLGLVSRGLLQFPLLQVCMGLLVSRRLRLNTADDPTREKEVRPSSELSIAEFLPVEALQQIPLLSVFSSCRWLDSSVRAFVFFSPPLPPSVLRVLAVSLWDFPHFRSGLVQHFVWWTLIVMCFACYLVVVAWTS